MGELFGIIYKAITTLMSLGFASKDPFKSKEPFKLEFSSLEEETEWRKTRAEEIEERRRSIESHGTQAQKEIFYREYPEALEATKKVKQNQKKFNQARQKAAQERATGNG
jgi:C4-dicarboxylate-specific signal transduction histidine kinase